MREVTICHEGDEPCSGPAADGTEQLTEDVTPAREREDRHPEPLAERQELLEDLLRLETLRHGGHRREVLGRPGAREVPVPLVPDRDHDPLALVERPPQPFFADGPDARRELRARERGQRERLAVVAHVRAHSCT